MIWNGDNVDEPISRLRVSVTVYGMPSKWFERGRQTNGYTRFRLRERDINTDFPIEISVINHWHGLSFEARGRPSFVGTKLTEEQKGYLLPD